MALRASMMRAMSAAAVVRFPSAGGGVLKSRYSVHLIARLPRVAFFGCIEGLNCAPSPLRRSWNTSRLLGTRAKIKRRKDPQFDNVIQREKKVRIVSKIKEILVKEPGKQMTLLQLGKNRKSIGLTGKRRVIALLNKFPAVFEVFEQGCNVSYVRFTPLAEEQYFEEQKLKKELEGTHVEKLRKLVMMSVDKRVLVSKITHIKKDLGLPDEFLTSVIPNYPQYFKLVETEEGVALEITEWDPRLAVTYKQMKAAATSEAAEQNAVLAERPRVEEDGGLDLASITPSVISNRRLNLPKGLSLSKKDRITALQFQQMPDVSPYDDAKGLDPASREAEKRAVATVHELLSLMVEKKTLVDHLTHFKKDYKFSQRIRAMLIRHPEVFYVSFKGHRDSVFLREAYEGSQLIEKDPLVQAKERLAELVGITRQQMQLMKEEKNQENDEDDYEDEDDDDYDEEEDDSEEDDYDYDEIETNLREKTITEGERAKSNEFERTRRRAGVITSRSTTSREGDGRLDSRFEREDSPIRGLPVDQSGLGRELVTGVQKPRERW